MAFSLEEKVDLLLKKVAFGKTKTNTSENTDGFGESIASPLLLRGDKVMKQSASIPSTPGAVNNIVQAYQGTDVVECTAATGTTDTNITGFKRAWSTGQQNWIPSEFSAAYTVEVYVGPSGWNGTDAIATTIGGTNGTNTGASVFRVVPGVESANWFFDYQAGVLYWTNEDESGAVGGSTELTSSIHQDDKVYIKGYKYIGDFGVGGTSDITGGASTIATANLTTDRALISNDSGKVVVSAVTSAELAILDGLTASTSELNILDGVTATAAELNILDGVTSTATELNILDGVTSTAAELNILDGVTSTATELNILDGVTSTAGEINLLDGAAAGSITNSVAVIYGAAGEVNATTLQIAGTSISSSAAELNILDGVTSSTAELNILDGVTATTAEINILDGVTSSTAELNILDGVTATTAEINILDGVTSTAAELNILDGVTSTATELNILDGVTATATEINLLDGVTSTTAELNILDGVTSSTAELNILDGVTSTAAELNLLDGATANSVVNSVAVIYGASGEVAASSLATTGNVTIGGSLTVQGDFIQETSTNVIFEDTFLDLNVPDTATADITSDSGLRFGTAASTASVLDKHAQLMYDATADKFKFTREEDAGNFSAAQAKSGADNVAALKFTKTDTNTQADQADGTTTMAAADEANASSARSLGAVAKCSITITTDAANVGDNYAPAEAGAVGYPIKHNLDTQSVFVVAIQTVNNSGSVMADPQPVYCKYIPEDDNTVRVSVGVTQATEQYDIIVIG